MLQFLNTLAAALTVAFGLFGFLAPRYTAAALDLRTGASTMGLSELRASVGGFMDRLFNAGAFQGEKASDAYYVKCGLGSTMTQDDVDAGVCRVVVGFAPLKPAEFVVVQIRQIVGQAS